MPGEQPELFESSTSMTNSIATGNIQQTCRLNPYKMDMYDGVNLSPLEVVFVKVKHSMLQAGWTAPKTSQTYDKWRADEVRARKRYFLALEFKASKPCLNSQACLSHYVNYMCCRQGFLKRQLHACAYVSFALMHIISFTL